MLCWKMTAVIQVLIGMTPPRHEGTEIAIAQRRGGRHVYQPGAPEATSFVVALGLDADRATLYMARPGLHDSPGPTGGCAALRGSSRPLADCVLTGRDEGVLPAEAAFA
jgi:hypothetical protein